MNKFLIQAVFWCFLTGWLIPANLDAALICTVTTDACATLGADYIEIFEMSATANGHAGLPAASYANFVCCGNVTGLGNNCSGTYQVAAKLSGTTNAHVEKNTEANYANNACLSIDSGTVDIAYQATNCDGYHTTLASMSGATTNAHVGNASAYANKICATATATAAVSVTVTSDGSINYQSVEWGQQQDTITLTDTQTVQNSGGGTINMEVQTSNATGGTGWTLASSIGNPNEYVHEFSTTTAPTWVKFLTPAETYRDATTSVIAGNSQDFDFRITVPQSTTDFGTKSITITVRGYAS